jgi:hypothetical protein
MLDNTDKTISQQNDILKNMQGYNSWFNKPFGAMPKEAQQAFKKIKQLQLEKNLDKDKLDHLKKLDLILGAVGNKIKDVQKSDCSSRGKVYLKAYTQL